MSEVLPTLVNRTEQAVFLDLLDQEIARSHGSGGTFALLLVRLRNLERLNVTLGYEGGDRALASVASRLTETFGARGRALRVGARKFALLLPGLKGEEHARLAAQKVERLCDAPLVIAGQQVTPAVVQGIALCPDHAGSAHELLQCAEAALGRAKQQEGTICVYDAGGTTQIRHSLRVESALLEALEDGGIEPHFQPVIELSTARLIGAEALLRCRDADGAQLPPEEVVEAAGRLRRLEDVTSVMINAALRYAAEWAAAGTRLRVAVNVSASSLRRSELVNLVDEALGTWGNGPETLVVEITESVFITQPERSFETLRRLRDLGVRVAIDDFGTGYSSLAYFRDIPATELKVDKSFVSGMLRDAASRKIVRAVIELAHAFELLTVAEGVEDAATARALADMGCDLAQGYWYSHPLPAADFRAWAARQRRGRTAPL